VKQKTVFLLSSAIVLIIALALATSSSPAAAQSSAPGTVTLSNTSCSGTQITISGLSQGSFAYLYAYSVSSNNEFVGYLAVEYEASTGSSVSYYLNWNVQYAGTEIYVDVASGQCTQPYYYYRYQCGQSAGPSAPPGSVLASFVGETQLYSAPSLSSPIAGKVLHAGQTWFVYEVSSDRKFVHVYVGGGQVAWALASNARLQGTLKNSVLDAENDDANLGGAAPTHVPYNQSVAIVLPPPPSGTVVVSPPATVATKRG